MRRPAGATWDSAERGIASQCAGAGTRDVGKNTIEREGYGEMLRVGVHDLDSCEGKQGMRVQQFLQQAGAVRMKFDGGNCGCGVTVRKSQRLAAGSGTAVENV